MAKNKTFETQNSVADYIAAIADERRRKDCMLIIDLMSKLSGLEPKMWGTGIVGFGNIHYRYDSGHEGTMPVIALASRVNAITLYLDTNFEDRDLLLSQLGKHKTSKACLYIKKLEDVDVDILSKMIVNSYAHSTKQLD